MGIFSFLRREKRYFGEEPQYSWLFEALGLGAKSKSGQEVNETNALKVTTVYACVRVIAESIASTPILLYSREKDKNADYDREIKKRNTKHPLSSILKVAPNEYMTAYEFKELMGYCLGLWGNFYSAKEIAQNGRILSLIPLLPEYIEIKVEGGEITYKYSHPNIPVQFFSKDEIWHVKGLSRDGIIGIPPISLMRESIGIAMSAEEYGAKFFENDARPTVALKTPAKLTDDQVKNLKDAWRSSYSKQEGAEGTAVLQGNWDLQIIGMPNQDAQFLETREFQVADICRAFRVPGVMVGLPDKTATFASAEQFFLSFVVHTMMPWFSRIENSIDFHLFNESERRRMFAEFQMNNLTRGDIATRYGAYQIAIQSRIMSPNEVRALENMNPYEGGDEFSNPNITPGSPGSSEEEPDEEDIEEDGTGTQDV